MLLELMASALDGACATGKIFAPGEISLPGFHEGLDWISDNGEVAMFTRVMPNFSVSELYIAKRTGAVWRTEKLSFSNGGYDAGAAFSRDMTSLVFTSTRRAETVPDGSWNIWSVSVSIEESGWRFGQPILLDAPVNSEGNECCAVFGMKGEIFFSSDRDGAWNIYRAAPVTNGYDVDKLDGGVNTADSAWPSAYIEESDTLLFSSIRKSGAGGDDIYSSVRVYGKWSEGRMLGKKINKAGYEDGARIFNNTFFWSSRRARTTANEPITTSDIFYMPAVCAAGGVFNLEQETHPLFPT